jgi:acetyltransferase-like isoleucine patch superfamily enzyme
MNYFVHEKALCESSSIGAGSRIWAFAHVLPGARIGADCNICDGVFIENDVVVGNNVTVKCGVQLWDGVTLEDDVFVGPNATFTNDIRPRSKVYPEAFLRTTVEQGASIGANATILPGLRIGRNAMIGAGAVVTRSVPPNAIVVGNPAKIVGYADGSQASFGETVAEPKRPHPSLIKGVQLHTLNTVTEMRGQSSGGEFQRDIPFTPARYHLLQGLHAIEDKSACNAQKSHQFLIALKGSVQVVANNDEYREQFVLDNPNVGLHLSPMTQGIEYKCSEDAMLLVFTSGISESSD